MSSREENIARYLQLCEHVRTGNKSECEKLRNVFIESNLRLVKWCASHDEFAAQRDQECERLIAIGNYALTNAVTLLCKPHKPKTSINAYLVTAIRNSFKEAKPDDCHVGMGPSAARKARKRGEEPIKLNRQDVDVIDETFETYHNGEGFRQKTQRCGATLCIEEIDARDELETYCETPLLRALARACVDEGLETNIQIAARLRVCRQTVKRLREQLASYYFPMRTSDGQHFVGVSDERAAKWFNVSIAKAQRIRAAFERRFYCYAEEILRLTDIGDVVAAKRLKISMKVALKARRWIVRRFRERSMTIAFMTDEKAAAQFGVSLEEAKRQKVGIRSCYDRAWDLAERSASVGLRRPITKFVTSKLPTGMFRRLDECFYRLTMEWLEASNAPKQQTATSGCACGSV